MRILPLTKREGLKRLSLESVEVQIRQSQPKRGSGQPEDVPKKSISILLVPDTAGLNTTAAKDIFIREVFLYLAGGYQAWVVCADLG